MIPGMKNKTLATTLLLSGSLTALAAPEQAFAQFNPWWPWPTSSTTEPSIDQINREIESISGLYVSDVIQMVLPNGRTFSGRYAITLVSKRSNRDIPQGWEHEGSCGSENPRYQFRYIFSIKDPRTDRDVAVRAMGWADWLEADRLTVATYSSGCSDVLLSSLEVDRAAGVFYIYSDSRRIPLKRVSR